MIETCLCLDLNWGSNEKLRTEHQQIRVEERIIFGIGFHFKNKKVLLHERKRHTACHTASVRCADLSWWEGEGYLSWPVGGRGGGGTYTGRGRVYLPWLGEGVPTLAGGGGTYHGQGGGGTLAGGYLPWLGEGHLPWLGGTPPRCGQTDACENSTFPPASEGCGGNNYCLPKVKTPEFYTKWNFRYFVLCQLYFFADRLWNFFLK